VTALTYEQLLDGAEHFADLSLRAYMDGEHRAILVNAGISMEQLSKALLISINPAFLVELRSGSFDSLLHLTGHADKAPNMEAPRTVEAKEALIRVAKVTGISATRDALYQIAAIRDSAVHSGAFGSDRTRELLISFLRYSNEVYDELDIGDGRWGEHANVVNALLEQSWTELQHEVHRKIAAAKARLRQLMEKIPEGQQQAVGESMQTVVASLAHRPLALAADGKKITGELVDCPACAHADALCIGTLFTDYNLPETIGPMETLQDAISFAGFFLEPTGLVCRVCGLTLAGVDEVRVAGLPASLGIREEYWDLIGAQVDSADHSLIPSVSSDLVHAVTSFRTTP